MELQKIQQMIYEVRGVKVMLDSDLAVLSENQEVTNLRYQNGTSSWGRIRYIDRIMCFS